MAPQCDDKPENFLLVVCFSEAQSSCDDARTEGYHSAKKRGSPTVNAYPEYWQKVSACLSSN